MLCSAIPAAAQVRSIDSLKAKLATSPQDATRLRLLSQLAEEFRVYNQLDSALLFAEQLRTAAERMGDKRGIGLYWQVVGRITAMKGQDSASLAALSAAIKIFRETSDSLSVAKALNAVGRTYFQQGRLTDALAALINALEIAERLNDKQTIATSLTNIGNVYVELREFSEAIAHYKKAEPLFKEFGDKQFVGFILNNLGICYQQQGRYDEAMSAHTQSLEIKLQQGDERGISDAYNNIGYLYELNGNYVAALENHQKSLVLRQKLRYKFETSESLYNVAHVYFKQDSVLRVNKQLEFASPRQDMLALALDYAKRAGDLATDIHAVEYSSRVLRLVSDIYTQLNRPTEALAAYKNFIIVRDSMFNQSSVKKMNELKVRYETQRKEKEIMLLQEEAENQTLIRNSLIGGITLFGLLLVLAINRYQLKQRSELALREKNHALDRALSDVEAQKKLADESSRVKSEILNVVAHDLQTPLSSVVRFAYLLKQSPTFTPKQSDMLERIMSVSQAMLRQTVNLLNAASERISSEMQREKVYLNDLLREVINDSGASKKGIEVSLRAEQMFFVIGDYDKLCETFDNLISNAVKYSPRGKQIEVSIRQMTVSSSQSAPSSLTAKNSLLIAVCDEGQGLTDDDKTKLFGKFQRLSAKPTAGESSTGLGLYITKQIVELHSGRIWAESDGLGHGTTFFVELPMYN
jgi:signal transduction histidine kinase/predicted negative regulator of RcsB-dependent stress response